MEKFMEINLNLQQEIKNDWEIENKFRFLINNKSINKNFVRKLDLLLTKFYEKKLQDFTEKEIKDYIIERYSEKVWKENLKYADIDEIIEYILG